MAEGLSKRQIEIITAKVLEIQEKKKKETKREKRDWKLRNTNLLLKNYRMLKKHCDSIVPTIQDYEISVFDSEALNLDTLMKYKARTKEMLDYFDLMFSSYNNYCRSNGDAAERRFDIIKSVYIEDGNFRKSKSEMASYYAIDFRTVDRDIKKATDELSIFLYGIDSLDDLANVLKLS
ncbi:hypothetical protein HRD96_05150 [Enterococcus faecalis]|nr:hypothetical protein [Enterococcus faecalis]